MHDIVGRTWATAHVECGPIAWTWLSSECDWASGHGISHKMYSLHTCTTQELWGRPSILHTSYPSTCCKSYRDGMDGWKHSSQLYWHALPVAPTAVARGPVTGAVSQATITNSINRLPCSYLYHSRHWIGKSLSGLHCCCRHRWGRLLMVHGFDCYLWALFENNT